MKRGHGIGGSMPALTTEQREAIRRDLSRRWEIKREIKRLEAELAELPTNEQLVAKYGVCVQTLHSAARKTYAHPHPLDRVPRETPTNNSGESA
jgi:hypothetical protein